MAAPIINFTSSIDTSSNPYKLIITDESDYTDSEVVLESRVWIITKSDGKKETFEDAVGELEYPITSDLALIVNLGINTGPNNQFVGYSKTKNILARPFLEEAIYDIRKVLVEQYDARCNDPHFEYFLQGMTLITYFEEASRTLISTDLVAAQKALDHAKREIENFQSYL